MADLGDLGLSEYETSAYRSLLHSGPTTAKELSTRSNVPMGRIYDVLNELEQQRLIRSQSSGRPKKYVAVEPEVALDRLLETKQRELNEQAEQYAEIVDSLVDDLNGGAPFSGQFWTAAVGPEETLELLLERIDAASEELIIVGGSPAVDLDIQTTSSRVVESLEAALERGVDVQLLVTPEILRELPPEVRRTYDERLTAYENYTVRRDEAVEGTFNLIDNAEVCLDVPNPLNPQAAFAMISLKDREFAADVRSVFQPRWEAAEPVEIPQQP